MPALTPRQKSILQAELTSDPLGRGYDGMTDQEKVDSLKTTDRTRPRTVMSAGEVMEHIDSAEFTTLDAAATTRVDRILGLGAEIIIGPGNSHNAVQELIAAFGGGSATIAALAAARDVPISRLDELGIPEQNVNATVVGTL